MACDNNYHNLCNTVICNFEMFILCLSFLIYRRYFYVCAFIFLNILFNHTFINVLFCQTKIVTQLDTWLVFQLKKYIVICSLVLDVQIFDFSSLLSDVMVV